MSLQNPKLFFDRVRDNDLLGPVLMQAEIDGCNAILEACSDWPTSHVAYALATAYHETAGTMQPITEMGGPEYLRRLYDVTGKNPDRARLMGNTKPGDGARYCGRGFVQLTWAKNYQRAEDELDVPLVANPSLACRPDIAAKIMEAGMREGWFTGKKNSSYLPSDGPGTRDQFITARRIINGTDKAPKIAEHAMDFQDALMSGGWK